MQIGVCLYACSSSVFHIATNQTKSPPHHVPINYWLFAGSSWNLSCRFMRDSCYLKSSFFLVCMIEFSCAVNTQYWWRHERQLCRVTGWHVSARLSLCGIWLAFNLFWDLPVKQIWKLCAWIPYYFCDEVAYVYVIPVQCIKTTVLSTYPRP